MRKIIFIIPLILCFLISFMVINFGDSERTIFENSINDYIIKTNALTMMYETEVGSGEYQISNDNSWPGDEYIFNETLSKCENASKLIWDNDAKKVLLQANTSDKCYVYFDKYNMPYVNNVEATEVTSDSITVNVTASGGDGSIVSYHYSINGGEYILSSNNVYTFENLTAETSYNISVFVTDSNGRKSNFYNVNSVTSKGLISFTIEDEIYYAEDGMTWREWVSSDYNTGGYRIILCGGREIVAVTRYLCGMVADTLIGNNYGYDCSGDATAC